MSTKPPTVTIVPWLKANLGKNALGGNTGTDQKALLAAVSIIELYSYDRDTSILHAFGTVVRRMQTKQRHLAFHAVTHVMDWSDRVPVWQGAGLPGIFEYLPKCEFEPKY